MAFDNPVTKFSRHGALRRSRVIEFGAVVVLTVAVVVVAALWGASSESSEPVSVGVLDSSSAVSVAEHSDGAQQGSSAGAAAGVDTELAEIESPAPETGADSAAQAGGASVVEVQTGIVPGRPDPVEPTLPQSFERYQVQRGESLFTIAAARGVTVTELVQWNWHLREDSRLLRGEWIWIPSWDTHSVADEASSPLDDGKSGRGGG